MSPETRQLLTHLRAALRSPNAADAMATMIDQVLAINAPYAARLFDVVAPILGLDDDEISRQRFIDRYQEQDYYSWWHIELEVGGKPRFELSHEFNGREWIGCLEILSPRDGSAAQSATDKIKEISR